MKKGLLIFLMTIFLVGCSHDPGTANDVAVDVTVNVTRLVETEPGVYHFSIQEQIELSETFEITQIELLDTGWGEFPYESHLIEEKNWKEYVEILNDLFSSLSETDSLGGDVCCRLGPKAKLVITLQRDNRVMECEFFQDSTNRISGMAIHYSDGVDVDVYKGYDEGYAAFYTRLNDLIG